MSSEKLKKTRTLVISNANDPRHVSSDSVTLSDNVLKRFSGESTGRRKQDVDSDNNKEENNYWNNRVSSLDEELKNIEKIHGQEFERARKSYTSDYSHLIKSDLCKTMVDKIADCYKNNSEETLRCSKIVEEFTSCMQAAGIDAINKL